MIPRRSFKTAIGRPAGAGPCKIRTKGHTKLKCLRCKQRPRCSPHPNTKYCHVCRAILVRTPKTSLTEAQKAKVRQLAWRLTVWEIADLLGSSRSSVIRYARDAGFSLATKKHLKYITQPDYVHEAMVYYGDHGVRATQKKYPDLNLKSLLSRRRRNNKWFQGVALRQLRWKPEEIIEAVRMAGVVNIDAQWKYFSRPRAKEGSIKSLWTKKLHSQPRQIHGMLS